MLMHSTFFAGCGLTAKPPRPSNKRKVRLFSVIFEQRENLKKSKSYIFASEILHRKILTKIIFIKLVTFSKYFWLNFRIFWRILLANFLANIFGGIFKTIFLANTFGEYFWRIFGVIALKKNYFKENLF